MKCLILTTVKQINRYICAINSLVTCLILPKGSRKAIGSSKTPMFYKCLAVCR